jgi:hypothetical protein
MSLMSLNLHLRQDGTTGTADGGRTDTSAATSAIAELRRLLAAPGMLTHPAVRNELNKLDEQLAAELQGGGGTPGRHRSGRGARPGLLAPAPAPGPSSPVPDHERDDQADEGHRDDRDGAGSGGNRAAQAARAG